MQPEPVIDEALYRYYEEQGYDISREEFEFFLDDYNKDIESEVKEKPKYIYTANAEKCEQTASGSLEVSKTLAVLLLDAFKSPRTGIKVSVKEVDGTEHNGYTDDSGVAVFENLIPGKNHIKIEDEEKTT
jgi:hypothetical protein